MTTATLPLPTDAGAAPTTRSVDPALVAEAIAKRAFALLATTSPAGRPHAAGVLYALDGDHLWVSTDRPSRKARNVAAEPHVAVSIPVRRLPLGPPAQIHFQTTAEVVDADDPELRRLAADGRLDAVTSHGELDRPGACFLRIALPERVHTYGLGMSLWQLLRNPLDAAGTATLA